MKNSFKGWSMMLFMILAAILISSEVQGLGMAPSRKVYDYTENTISGSARILNNDGTDMRILLYAQGEYSENIKISQSEMFINASEYEKEFTYTIRMPPGLSPGTKKLSIVAMAVPTDLKIPDVQTMIVSTLSVAHQIWVEVPYPGIFAEGYLYISEGNVGDTITFTANVLNKGTDTIKNIEGELIIKGPTNEEIYRVKSSTFQDLAVQTSGKLLADWKADVNPGMYEAEFIINYDGKQIVLRKQFTIGSFQLEISSISTGTFKLGTIAKFDIDIVNKWNQPVSSIYADLQVLDTQGSMLTSVRTAPSDVQASSSSILTAYWDTQGVNVGTYDIKVILYYSGKTSEKLFKAVIGIDSIVIEDVGGIGRVIASGGEEGKLSLLYILVIISIVFNILLFIYFKFMRKKNEP